MKAWENLIECNLYARYVSNYKWNILLNASDIWSWDWNASVTHLAASQYVPSKLHMENSLHQKKSHAEWFLTVNAQSILPHANKRVLDIMRQNWGKWKGQQSLGIKPRTPGLCNQSSTHRLTSQRRNSEGVVEECWKWLHFVVDTLRPNTWMKHCIMATGKIFSLERWIYYSLSQPPRLLILW